jgi:hypothetical protein
VPSLRRAALCPLILFLAAPVLAGDDFRVAAGTIEDSRGSDSRMGGLSIELKLTGPTVKEVKALRVRISSARDDLGSILNRPVRDDHPAEFEEFSPDRHPGPSLRLASPRRDASTVDAAGEIELFIPGRDPDTKQRFDAFQDRLDKPIASPALKAARVEITPLSAGSYRGRERTNRPTKEQIAAEGKKQGASEAEIKQALDLMDALAKLSDSETPNEKTVLLETKDPDGRIISIDVVAADGSEIHAPSRSSSGGREDKLVKIDLSEKPPAGAALLVTMRTSKSTVTIPLALKAVVLP